jgi:hypothetical protein
MFENLKIKRMKRGIRNLCGTAPNRQIIEEKTSQRRKTWKKKCPRCQEFLFGEAQKFETSAFCAISCVKIMSGISF